MTDENSSSSAMLAGVPMTARDALNYYHETDKTVATVLHAYVVDVAGVDTAVVDRASAVAFVRTIVDLDPVFRRVLHPIGWDLDYPYWVESEVDVDKHVFVWNPAPEDGARFVTDKIIELSTHPIGFELPPWRFHFILDCHGVDGVPDGGTVLLFNNHHSAIDGMGVVELMNRVLGPSPAARVDRPPTPLPTRTRALRRLPGELLRLGRTTVVHGKEKRRLEQKIDADARRANEKVLRPATRFNRNIDPDMVFRTLWLDLDRVKRVKSSFSNITLNDLLLTVISLGFSEYLREDGELPAASLATSIPISTRTFADSTWANQITMGTVSLHTDIADPVERLMAVHDSAAAAKKLRTMMATSLPPDPLLGLPAPISKALKLAVRHPPEEPTSAKINTMVTNIAYGAVPIHVAGAPVVGVLAPLNTAEGIQLSHCIMSAGSTLSLSVTSNGALMPDTSRYIDHLLRAFETLEKLAQ